MPHISSADLERIAELKTKFLDSSGPKMMELQALTRQFQIMMAKNDIDRKLVLDLQGRINGIHADLANQRLVFELDMLESLPVEARERMRRHKLMAAAFSGPGEWQAGWPPPFGPPMPGMPPGPMMGPGFKNRMRRFGAPPMPPGCWPPGAGEGPGEGPDEP